MIQEKALFDALRGVIVWAQAEKGVVRPFQQEHSLKLQEQTLMSIANNETALMEFQAGLVQALRGLSPGRQERLVSELTDHYEKECKKIQNDDVREKIQGAVQEAIRQAKPQINENFVEQYARMDIDTLIEELALRGGTIQEALSKQNVETQRKTLSEMFNMVSRAPPHSYYRQRASDRLTEIAQKSDWARKSGALSKEGGNTVNIVVMLGKSGVFKQDAKDTAARQARANHMALWGGMGDQFQLGARVTLNMPVLTSTEFVEEIAGLEAPNTPVSTNTQFGEQISGLVAPLIQDMKTLKEVAYNREELDKIDTAEAQQVIIIQGVMGAWDLHDENIGLVATERDTGGNVTKYGVRCFDDDHTFGNTNTVVDTFGESQAFAAVRINLLGTPAANQPLSKEMRDHILAWDPKRWKEEFMKQPGFESDEKKKQAADALEQRVIALQQHIRANGDKATARSSIFIMFPLAEFSFNVGLVCYRDEYRAGQAVGNYTFPLPELVDKALNLRLIAPETASKLRTDLKNRTYNTKLWEEATKEMNENMSK